MHAQPDLQNLTFLHRVQKPELSVWKWFIYKALLTPGAVQLLGYKEQTLPAGLRSKKKRPLGKGQKGGKGRRDREREREIRG